MKTRILALFIAVGLVVPCSAGAATRPITQVKNCTVVALQQSPQQNGFPARAALQTSGENFSKLSLSCDSGAVEIWVSTSVVTDSFWAQVHVSLNLGKKFKEISYAQGSVTVSTCGVDDACMEAVSYWGLAQGATLQWNSLFGWKI